MCTGIYLTGIYLYRHALYRHEDIILAGVNSRMML